MLAKLKKYDRVVLSGTSGSSHYFIDLNGTIAAANITENSILVWPSSQESQVIPEEYYFGKIWFDMKNVDKIEVVH